MTEKYITKISRFIVNAVVKSYKFGILTIEDINNIKKESLMDKYKVKIRTSYGEISEEAKLINNKEYYFVPSGYIVGGPVSGEIKMVPNDPEYPVDGPKELALGDLEVC